jgi:sugar/nucleoside kinase (ribokinase family)
MKNILLIGSILVEHQYLVDKIATQEEVVISNKKNTLTSGKVINAGRLLAINNNVSIFSSIGNDNEGNQAIEELHKYNIDTSWVSKTTSLTGQVIVITDRNGKTAITFYPGATKDIKIPHKELIKKFQFIYMETSFSLNKIYSIIKIATQAKIPIFLDFPNQQKEFNKLHLKEVEFIVPNRQEAELLVGKKINTIQDAVQASRYLRKYSQANIIITLDKDGCVFHERQKYLPIVFSTTKKKVIDATGSGDIFRGILLDEYLKTNNLVMSIRKAISLASESTLYEGVNHSINKIIKEYTNN